MTSNEYMRRGKFSIMTSTIETAFHQMKLLMKDVVVLHVETRLDTGMTTYYAIHPSFDVINEGEKIPEYSPVFMEPLTSVSGPMMYWTKRTEA